MLADVDVEGAERAASELDGDARAVRCDVTVAAEVVGAVEATAAAFGGLDVLVNNAGVEISKPMVEHGDEEFSRLLAVNMGGVFMCSKYAVPALAEGGGGAIVNIASVAGLGGSPLLSAYCASKAAVIRFTEVCATELRDQGIRANAVCPAFVGGAMVDRMVGDFEAATGQGFEDVVAAKQGRLGTAEEVAETAAFLASDDAAFVTGAHYVLDGGLTAALL